jgi:hypothetical protein
MRKNRVVKVEISKEGKADTLAEVVEDPCLQNANMRKMYIDDQGIHCILLVGTEVYYTNWDSKVIVPIKITPEGGDQISFSCVTIHYVDDEEPNLFELVLGSDDGKIFMRTIEILDVREDAIELNVELENDLDTRGF